MRKIIAISLLLGLLCTLGTAYFTMSEEFISYSTSGNAITPGLCTGIPHLEEENYRQKTGIPIRHEKVASGKVDHCSASEKNTDGKASQLRSYIASWQFFANWAIWTLPFLGLGYVIRSYSKRLRAHRQIEKAL